MTQYSFILTGKIKPYVRMTRRGKFKRPEALEYMASQEAIGWQLTNQMSLNNWSMLPKKTPLKIHITAVLPRRLFTFDVDNLGKALLDAAQGVVFPNDLWVIETRFTKTLGKDYQAYMFVETA